MRQHRVVAHFKRLRDEMWANKRDRPLQPRPASWRQSRCTAVTSVICRSPAVVYTVLAFGSEMVMAEHSRARVSLWSRCQIAIIVLAIFSLAASLATRYSALGSEVQKIAAVKSQSPDVQRQRLLSNALQWTAPAASFTLFQPPRSSVLTVSVVVPSTNLNSESWLYNRPPPSC